MYYKLKMIISIMSKFQILEKVKMHLRRMYRITRSFEKQEELVWNDLKKFHASNNWKSGVFERDKYIEVVFRLNAERPLTFYYMINDKYRCKVKVLENFPEELTTDIFILATHLNNMLENGIVVVNVNSRCVEYSHNLDAAIPLLYNYYIYGILLQHFNLSKKIYFAFERLVTEQEAPAIIIADLLKKNDDRVEKPE